MHNPTLVTSRELLLQVMLPMPHTHPRLLLSPEGARVAALGSSSQGHCQSAGQQDVAWEPAERLKSWEPEHAFMYDEKTIKTRKVKHFTETQDCFRPQEWF